MMKRERLLELAGINEADSGFAQEIADNIEREGIRRAHDERSADYASHIQSILEEVNRILESEIDKYARQL